MRIKLFQNDTWNFKVYFIDGCSYEQAHKRVCKKFNIISEKYDGSLSGVYWWINNNTAVIWIDQKEIKIEQKISLTHECLHITGHALRSRSCYFEKDSDEAYCYLHSWLMRNGLRFYKL